MPGYILQEDGLSKILLEDGSGALLQEDTTAAFSTVAFSPDDDSVDGGWLNQSGSNVNLYDSVDESTASDTDYIISPNNPAAAVCKIRLSDPPASPLSMTLSYRFNNDAGTTLNVRLLQGASEIAAWEETGTGSWTTVNRTLTTVQFALISNFTDLFVELEADSGDPTLVLDLDFTTGTLDSKVTFTRSTTATRINASGVIVSAAIDAPRFDYDPVTLAPRGLLLEEQRTNILSNSLINGTNLGTQTVTVTAAAHTLSFYGTGTITLSGVSTAGPLAGSGAYPTRSSLTFTPTAGSLTLTVTGTVQYAQLEVGAFASSFIPTTTAVTRAPDSASMTSTNFSSWFNATEGTFVMDAAIRSALNGRIFIVIGATDNEMIEVYNNDTYPSGYLTYRGWDGGANQWFIDYGYYTPGTRLKLAAAYKLNDIAFCHAGGSVSADATATLPTLTTFTFREYAGGSAAELRVARLAYYNVRKVNADLQALTA